VLGQVNVMLVDVKKASSKAKTNINVLNASMDVLSVILIPILVLIVEILNISKVIFATLVQVTASNAQMEVRVRFVMLDTYWLLMDHANSQTLTVV
jgi:hypothetical protein